MEKDISSSSGKGSRRRRSIPLTGRDGEQTTDDSLKHTARSCRQLWSVEVSGGAATDTYDLYCIMLSAIADEMFGCSCVRVEARILSDKGYWQVLHAPCEGARQIGLVICG